MIESFVGILSNPLYLLIVAVGVLSVMRQRARLAAREHPGLVEEVAEEDPLWTQAQATLLQALGALGFQQNGDVAGGSRLLLERGDLAVSVDWDVRRRQVSARVSEPLARSGASAGMPPSVARQNLFTCQLPGRGKADRVIAQLTDELKARTASPGV